MKTQKRTVGQWLRSLFFKPKKEVIAPKVEITEEEILQDPFGQPIEKMEKFTLNEIPELKIVSDFERTFDPKQKFRLEILGTDYLLTEKQLMFYNTIKKYQTENDGIKGWKISYEFVKQKHNLSDQDLAQLPKWKFKLSSHNKTMKYLLSSGIVYRVNGNKFKAK